MPPLNLCIQPSRVCVQQNAWRRFRVCGKVTDTFCCVNLRADAFVDAAPDRMIWGTYWPHVMLKKQMPNDGDLCDLLADWIPDLHRRNQVLVDNPANLYGFH